MIASKEDQAKHFTQVCVAFFSLLFGSHSSRWESPDAKELAILQQMKEAIVNHLSKNPHIATYCQEEYNRQHASTSKACKEVSGLLSELEWLHEREVSIFEIEDNAAVNDNKDLLMNQSIVQMFALDMANKKEKKGFEFDGPSHFVKGITAAPMLRTDRSSSSSSTCLSTFESKDGGLNGKSLFKRRLLKALGWKVVHIHYQDWDKCKSNKEKKDYVRKKLIKVHGT